MLSIFGASIVLYFIKILSGSRNIPFCCTTYLMIVGRSIYFIHSQKYLGNTIDIFTSHQIHNVIMHLCSPFIQNWKITLPMIALSMIALTALSFFWDYTTEIDYYFNFIIIISLICIHLKIGYSPYVNKVFVYISILKILNFIQQLFIFSCFYSIINYQDTTIRLCKNIKWNKNLQ